MTRIHTAFTIVKNTLDEMGIADYHLALPANAYLDGDCSEVLSLIEDLDGAPFSASTHHYYGPVDVFLKWVEGRIVRVGGTTPLTTHILTELGSPGPDLYQENIPDRELAQCFTGQIMALAQGCGFFDKMYYHSLKNGLREGHSLIRVENGHPVPKDAYKTFVIMAKLLARVKAIAIDQKDDFINVSGTRGDGIRFSVVWSRRDDRDITFPIEDGGIVFNAFGERTGEVGTLTLEPKPRKYLAGPARIIIY